MMNERLQALREQIKKQGLQGYVQPVHDLFMSEYPPACNQRLAWLTGFTGSAGVVAVLGEKAALFTDGRYTLQAQQQLDAVCYQSYNSAEVSLESWLAQHAQSGDAVGYDAQLFTQDALQRLEKTLHEKNIRLVGGDNLIDTIWADRPPQPASALMIHELQYAGVASADKRQKLAQTLKEKQLDAFWITQPDSLCWLLNIRARDTQCTPLLLAHAIAFADGLVTLLVDESRAASAVRKHLGEQVRFVSPESLNTVLQTLAGKKIGYDRQSTPVWCLQQLAAANAVAVAFEDPCTLPKATKNLVELQGICAAHLRDGVALTKLLCWLDEESKKHSVTEIEVADQLLNFRKEQTGFVEPSFATIAGSGPNGAIVHYHATATSNRTLQRGELFLLDSGGQYPDGTTDVTRTVIIGTPNAEHKDRFTRVLKGHIALALAQFPVGTRGSQLDTLARQFLWQIGLDYDHGTGHGVGCFLGVHEGPQHIGKRGGDAALAVGMIVSNEPGYYKNGAYGIRIENLVTVVEKESGFLGFDTLTCAPIDIRLIDPLMLTTEEKQWLNHYHHWVYSKLSAHLQPNEKEWLAARCHAI